MLSVVICSISLELLQNISQNIHSTIGVEHEIIVIDNRERHWSIARAYNEGARQARYPYLFFVHEDVIFHSQNWGKVIAAKLAEPDCGVIGFAGTKIMFDCYSGWMQHRHFACTSYFQRKEGKMTFIGFNVVQGEEFAEVVAVDGFGMFVRKDVWKTYPFDEKILTGFHCYDVDFSLQIAVGKQYRNYVCCSPEVLVEHLSEGNYNCSWCQDTVRMYNRKWRSVLPVKVNDLHLTDEEMKRYTEKSFNRFLRKSFKVDYPEKKEVLTAFLSYPFSFEHLLHCISGMYTYMMTKRNDIN